MNVWKRNYIMYVALAFILTMFFLVGIGTAEDMKTAAIPDFVGLWSINVKEVCFDDINEKFHVYVEKNIPMEITHQHGNVFAGFFPDNPPDYITGVIVGQDIRITAVDYDTGLFDNIAILTGKLVSPDKIVGTYTFWAKDHSDESCTGGFVATK